MGDVLTAKQAKFVEHYAETKHGTRSAIFAGYAKNSAHITASKLLIHPKIKKALSKRQERISKGFMATVDDIIIKLSEMGLGEGGIKDSDRLKAIELLGKHLGLWQADRATGKIDVNVTTRDMTREQAVELLKERLKVFEEREALRLTEGVKDE